MAQQMKAVHIEFSRLSDALQRMTMDASDDAAAPGVQQQQQQQQLLRERYQDNQHGQPKEVQQDQMQQLLSKQEQQQEQHNVGVQQTAEPRQRHGPCLDGFNSMDDSTAFQYSAALLHVRVLVGHHIALMGSSSNSSICLRRPRLSTNST
jgi:hypothetical protein